MYLKKNLKSPKAQSSVEYLLVFTVLVAAIIAVPLLETLNPDKIGLRSFFNNTVRESIEKINE